MDYNREEARRRAELQKILNAQRELEKKLAESKRAVRNAKNRLLASTTKSEQWHRMTLASLDRNAGYEGEMAAARLYLRHLPWEEYRTQMAAQAARMPDGTPNIEVEYALVCKKQEDWTAMGNAMLLKRAKEAYAADAASFRKWEQENPDSKGWRDKPAKRNQGFLIARMAEALRIDPPARMNRGEAHDWITHHGGNPRLTSIDTPRAEADTGTSGHNNGPSNDHLHSGLDSAE